MAKVEGERVAIVTDGITLKAIPLLLVGDAELQTAPSLKAESLLINTNPLPRNLHLGCILVELVEEMLDLP